MENKIKQLAECSVPEISDVGGNQVQITTDLRPVWTGAKVCGPVFTIGGKGGDNLAMHQALYHCPPGSVIVGSVDGNTAFGHWGGLMAVAAKAKGIAGLVLDGAVRDVDEFETLGFPVIALGINPRKSNKDFRGKVNESIQLAGIEVNPGDVILADIHGVAVFASEILDGLLQTVATLKEREAGIIKRLEAGERFADILGLSL
ncbi:MAG: RraA family protein [Acidobacteria bacterium]|nr:RraA family protein [Acidobacteriota bacterium]